MKQTKKDRLLENIFDVIAETMHYDKARKELTRDLSGHNISYNPHGDCIEIQNSEGTRALYTLTITK